MNLQAGTLLQGGKYRITRFIGSGGFGCTYEAEHVMLGRRVAIKEFFVHDFCNRDGRTSRVTVGTESKKELVEKLKRKFIDEARALNGLHHPGIVSVSDVFEENGTAYYVMDYIEGRSLSEMVEREGILPEGRAVRYVRQVAEALRYVHGHNRLHLDVKPGNIMVNRQDDTVLIDFGASKQYDEENGENTSTLVGKTPGYAPPEQMGNNLMRFTPTTDIYALGATLYKTLTGKTPLDATLLISGETLDPLPATVSEATRKAVTAAMQLNKRERPQTMDAFIGMLDARRNALEEEAEATVIEKKPTPTPNNPNRQTAQKPSANGAKVIGIVAGIVVIIILLWAIPWSGSETPTANNATEVAANTHTSMETSEETANTESSAAEDEETSAVESAAQQAARVREENERLSAEVREREERERLLEEERERQARAEAERQRQEEAEKQEREENDPAKQFEKGLEYYKQGNYAEAVKWYRRAAEQGNSTAQNNLGECYKNGQGVRKDDVEAVKWYRKAAEQGNADAQFNLGLCYYYFRQGVKHDNTEAVKWFRKAAKQGHAEAQNRLGECYYFGQGVEHDYANAEKWYRKAAEQGHAGAQYSLGYQYYNGRGVARNRAEAVKWFRKAAEQGHADAQYSLGNCYYNGRGVAKDETEAVKWYRKAADQGKSDAKERLRKLGYE